MTAIEQQTLIKLSQQFSDFIEEDTAWKKNITAQLEPILKERFDREVVSRYGHMAWRVLATAIGTLAAIGAIFNYLIRPYLLHFK